VEQGAIGDHTRENIAPRQIRGPGIASRLSAYTYLRGSIDRMIPRSTSWDT
jgi:hypothetical protein